MDHAMVFHNLKDLKMKDLISPNKKKSGMDKDPRIGLVPFHRYPPMHPDQLKGKAKI
jgi:hypothetical protein